VVVEDDVDEPVSHHRVMTAAAGLSAVAVPVTGAPAQGRESASRRLDAAQLLHNGVQQLAGRGVLVAGHEPLAALEPGQPADPAALGGTDRLLAGQPPGLLLLVLPEEVMGDQSIRHMEGTWKAQPKAKSPSSSKKKCQKP
jgi:hypothetical protein